MNVSSFVFEQVLKQLKIPAHAIRHLQIAGQLSDVDGSGFPAELFQLSAPMITRGLLNFALLQMRKDWLYPFWVHQQLDPNSKSFVARSQNPLLLNITHRNWTMLGSPYRRTRSNYRSAWTDYTVTARVVDRHLAPYRWRLTLSFFNRTAFAKF